VQIPVPAAGNYLPQAMKACCLAFMLVSPAGVLADGCSNGCKALSRDGHFQVVVTPAGERIPLREYHDWTVEVQDAKGNPVKLDGMKVAGGMPGHGHGLPSEPKVTEYLGDGRYLLTGFLFNMHGDWTLRFYLAKSGVQDIADLTFSVDY